ncbi:hypothetical protein VTN96DRAFT_7458 [Rasamsonia emersonii]
MGSPGLHSLPTEVILILLQSLSSSKDLHALIRASAPCYRTFNTYQSSVFAAVLQNAIHPEAQLDAMMVLEAVRIKNSMKRCSEFIEVRKDILDYLKKYPSREPVSSLREIAKSDHKQLQELFRLYSSIEGFISDYCDRALRYLNTVRPPSTVTGSTSATLSPTELGRLQRAFFRFETFANIFQIFSLLSCPWASDWLRADAEPPSEFLKMFSPWEQEELACVTQYVVTLVGEIFDKVEDEFVHAVEEAVATRRHQDGDDNGHDNEDEIHVLMLLDLQCMRFFKASYKQRYRVDHIDFVISRGLVFVKKLLSLEPLPLRQEVLKSAHDREQFIGNLQVTLACVSNNTRRGISSQQHVPGDSDATSFPAHAEADSLTDCNLGWLWAFDYNLVTVDRDANYDLRDQGYVFWDRERFPEGGSLRSSRSPGGADDFHFPFGGRSSQSSSVEERLMHLEHVPQKVFEESVPFYAERMRRILERLTMPIQLSLQGGEPCEKDTMLL